MIRVFWDWETEARGPRGRAAALDLRELKVAAVKGNGFKATDQAWYNWSQYADASIVIMPQVGDVVRVGLDKRNFIQQLAIVAADGTAQPRAIAGGAPAVQLAPTTVAALAATRKPEPEPDWLAGAVPAEPASFAGGLDQDTRGTIITRLAALNTATAILSSGGGAATLDEVLATAARLEAWALR